jgi:hypothetical protein
MLLRLLLAIVLIATPAAAVHAGGDTLARYSIAEHGKVFVDEVSGDRTPVTGFSSETPGPIGSALQLDGLSTAIAPRPVAQLTAAGQPWSISCWVKLDALPWNEGPLVDQKTRAGSLFFGIDAQGRLVAEHRLAGQKPVRLVSTGRLAPREWMLVGLSSSRDSLSFSVNGKSFAASPAAAAESSANAPDGSQAELLVGHVRAPQLPYPSNAIHPLLPISYSLEGAIADLTVRNHSLTGGELRKLLAGIDRTKLQPAPAPSLPRWTGGPGPFGAFHTSLRYEPTWDSPRRVAPDSDIVVRFAQAPVQLVFWQGANYIPAWVTENGRWYSDEFMEIYGKPRCPDGEDCEPMSDKQVRYSHVDIIESTPARAVVHWRYALCEVENEKLADAPTPADWGAWADEYWTVYPDAVAVRRQVLWTDHPGRESSEFQESIVIIPAGETPEDNLYPDALSLANLNGDSRNFSWPARTDSSDFAKPRGPDHFAGIDAPMIQWINLRSQWKPFQVAGSGPARFEGINWEPSMSAFEWWNHWPVAQIRSSGRPALTSDRPSHTSLSHIYWPLAHQDERQLTRILLTGLTLDRAGALAPRARSWLSPPTAMVTGVGASAATARFDPAQRAYVIDGPSGAETLRIDIDASQDHPLVNPAFVVANWTGTASAELDSGGSMATHRAEVGYVDRLEGRTLVVYFPLTATSPASFVLTRNK